MYVGTRLHLVHLWRGGGCYLISSCRCPSWSLIHGLICGPVSHSVRCSKNLGNGELGDGTHAEIAPWRWLRGRSWCFWSRHEVLTTYSFGSCRYVVPPRVGPGCASFAYIFFRYEAICETLTFPLPRTKTNKFNLINQSEMRIARISPISNENE